jgi:hypothetical protein
MMAWIAAPEHPPMDEVMAAQVVKLREQMVSAPPELEPDAAQMEQMQQMQSGHMMGWHPGVPMPGHGVIRVGHVRLGG